MYSYILEKALLTYNRMGHMAIIPVVYEQYIRSFRETIGEALVNDAAVPLM
jgi:hypothetical protein